MDIRLELNEFQGGANPAPPFFDCDDKGLMHPMNINSIRQGLN